MNILSISLSRRGLFLALAVLFLPLAASAQNRPDRADRLTEALDLTNEQVVLVQKAVGDEADRGDLWAVAAALTPTLTDAQKEKLFTRPERPARDNAMRDRSGARKGNRGQRGDRRQRERPGDDARAERREASLDAMQGALGLSDAQTQQLEALHTAKQAERQARRELSQGEREERRAERPEPGELPAEVAAILTPQQQEIATVHRALAARMMHGRMRSPRR
jgi:hypothetical protein